jgi:hypothetical protein
MTYECPTVVIEGGFSDNKKNVFGYGAKELRESLAKSYAEGILNFVNAYKRES